MTSRWPKLLVITWMWGWFGSSHASEPLKSFLNKYCADCHQGEKPSGSRNFEELFATGDDRLNSENQWILAQEIVDQLNLSAMPPEDSNQPSHQEKLAAIERLNENLAVYRESKITTRTSVLRRLNAKEYRNSVADLLGLDSPMFHPELGFPADQRAENLDNQGDALVTSGFLLSAYLQSAEDCVEKVLSHWVKPEVKEWRFEDGFRQQPEVDQVHGPLYNFQFMILYDVIHADKPEGAYGPIRDFPGAPHDGYYEIEFDATALNREHPYDDEFLARDRTEPLRLGIMAGRSSFGKMHLPQPIEPLLWEKDLSDGEARYKTKIWLDRGFSPRFVFRNGLIDVREMWASIKRKYPDRFPPMGGIVENRKQVIQSGHLPQIRIDNIAIRGPLYSEWPRAIHRSLLGADAKTSTDQDSLGAELTTEELKNHLGRIAARAYRRPVRDSDIEPLLSIATGQKAKGRSSLEALGDAVKAILCSPHFLYLDEPLMTGGATASETRLSNDALAGRLSYWLWSSPPDEILREAASREGFLKPSQIDGHVRRMLKDARSQAFVDGFLDAWLNLHSLGSMPPDRNRFKLYYHMGLGTSMKMETRLLFKHMIDENLSISNFLECEFTFADRSLAKLYGMDRKLGFEFEKVASQDPRRRGLLGHASVLTVSANGIDTSPVVRGVWVLENLLGTPPLPPPPDVEPLDPDVRGSVSIRDQLQKHRDNPTCYECHRKIDPFGFALENFDAIGQWRSKYSNKSPIDSAGELPGGKSFSDIQGLRGILVENTDLFARGFVTKLASYALGRRCGIHERHQIDAILKECQPSGYRLRDLMESLATSSLFQSP
jgi:hypothetical protein